VIPAAGVFTFIADADPMITVSQPSFVARHGLLSGDEYLFS
jgi:hypothetical protein